MKTITGGCLCRKIRFRITAEPIAMRKWFVPAAPPRQASAMFSGMDVAAHVAWSPRSAHRGGNRWARVQRAMPTASR